MIITRSTREFPPYERNITYSETYLQRKRGLGGMIRIQAGRRVSPTKTVGTNEDEYETERFALASSGRARPRFRLNAALSIAMVRAMVWIVSSLRVHRPKALWRVSFGLKEMRGASGYLLP